VSAVEVKLLTLMVVCHASSRGSVERVVSGSKRILMKLKLKLMLGEESAGTERVEGLGTEGTEGGRERKRD
jgi:hypothetical protein